MTCAPHRFLANDRNLVPSATLTPSSVEPVEDQVLAVPLARVGTGEVRLSGPYAGDAEAEYEVEIVDTASATPLVSAPVFAGKGSARLVDVVAPGVASQEIVVELVDAGKPATFAAVSFEGVTLQARAIGAGGNALRVSIDQTGLTFAETDYSLLEDLRAGQGGPNAGLEGAGFDWDTAVLGADNLIPSTAHRVAFGEDRSTVYLAYKRYVDNRWLYHFVPELKRDVAAGTPVLFVTGGRTVTISADGSPDEVYTGVATVYDLLAQVRAASQLVTVEGVVANDRSPTGQASRDLLARTDAHVQPSTGSGSEAAKGVASAFANSNARTELITAKCFAVTGKDHPLARLGAERWQVSSSLGGIIGEAVTGVAFVDPSGRFGFTIPQRLPPGYGVQKGRFSHVSTAYVTRAEDVEPPPICPVSLTLGTEAVDGSITLRWTKRPSGDCNCSSMAVPRIGGRCLGVFSEGGDDVSYTDANLARAIGLHQWFEDFTRANSSLVEAGSPPTTAALVDAAIESPNVFDSVRVVVGWYADVLVQLNAIDGNSPDLATGALVKWDEAFQKLQDDLESFATGDILVSIPSMRYRAALDVALITGGIDPLGKSDASTLESGDGCWRDMGGTHWFTVEGPNGSYAPLFPNVPYYSARRAGDEGKFFATFEFGLQLNIKCPQGLLEGDTVTLVIGDAGWPSTYNVGDLLTLPVIAAAPLYLAGGRDDDSTQHWSVTGSVDGPFAEWAFVPGGSPTAYDSGVGLAWSIVPGGIANAKGDRWKFEVKGYRYRWRKDAGAWSSAADVPASAVSLDDGLLIDFRAGVAPSFAVGDLYRFVALQPWAVGNLRRPTAAWWAWSTETGGATLDLDLGSERDLDTLAIAMHTIPAGATITLAGGDSAPDDWTETITWREGLIVQTLSQARAARYLRLTLTDADGGRIGWLWLGEALAGSLSADVQIRGSFRVARGSGPLFGGGATLGRTRSARVEWGDGHLSEDDAEALAAMFEHVKANDDEPLILLPHVARPADALLGRIEEDELEFTELSGHQRNDSTLRRYSASLTIAGVLQQQ